MDLTEGSETSAKQNMPLEKNQEKHIQYSEQGENLKSREVPFLRSHSMPRAELRCW
jgi:hypothetical protein